MVKENDIIYIDEEEESEQFEKEQNKKGGYLDSVYHGNIKRELMNSGIPWDVSAFIVDNYLLKDYSRKVFNILRYGVSVRKNYYIMKNHFKDNEQSMNNVLEPLWVFFDMLSTGCKCPICSDDGFHSSCYVKNIIHRSLSKYYTNVPLYKRGTYEKYIGYITRKLTKGKRKTCKKNIIKIAKLIVDFGLKLTL
jgi:hypothetical protein